MMGVGEKRQTRIGDFFHWFWLYRRKWATPCPHNCHKIPLHCTIATLNEGENIGAFTGTFALPKRVSRCKPCPGLTPTPRQSRLLS